MSGYQEQSQTIKGTIMVTIEIHTKQWVGNGFVKCKWNAILIVFGYIFLSSTFLIEICIYSLKENKDFQHTKADPALRADRDRREVWLERPPGCIHPNWSEHRDPLFFTLCKVLPVKSLSCRVKGHANCNSIFLSETILSSPTYHKLIYLLLCLLPLSLSISDALAYWSVRREDH